MITLIILLASMISSALTRLVITTHCSKIQPFYGFVHQCRKMKTLSEWNFERPSRLEQLPFDSVKENVVRRVRNAVFSHVLPTKLETEPKLVAASSDVLLNILDLDPSEVNNKTFLEFIAGNYLLPGCHPFSHRYGGYQFGFWADQLGDGRAHILGGYVNNKGDYWELQLKGSGKTPYSRNGDGRAVLRSSIREFLCSEAMHGLGIPTSRAAAVIVSNDTVIRDQFYNGRIRKEQAAVVLRLAPSWFRIGSLEILAREEEIDILKQLVDFIISNYYPQISPGKYIDFYKRVYEQSISLVAQWMAVGFAHGVLNTDNISLLSITIDYGPFGFLDSYNPVYIPNYTDDEGRYCYANQPYIFKWNLARLADALEPLISKEEMKDIRKINEDFDEIYRQHFLKNFRKKLGFSAESDQHEKLIALLLDMMDTKNCDFTQTFRQLGEIDLNEKDFSQYWALHVLSSHRNFSTFMELYRDLINQLNVSEVERKNLMQQANPQYVLRNWMAEAAIRQAENDDFHLTNLLLRILQNPFQKDPEAEEAGFSKPPPSWSRTLKVSCSS